MMLLRYTPRGCTHNISLPPISSQYLYNTKEILKNKCNVKCPILCHKCYEGLLEKRKTTLYIYMVCTLLPLC